MNWWHCLPPWQALIVVSVAWVVMLAVVFTGDDSEREDD